MGDALGASLEGIRILVVEDDPDSLEFLILTLSNMGAVAKGVASADGALSELTRRSYDILISDIVMPRKDGFALIEAMRRGGSGRTLPAIAVTGLGGPECARALALGYQACLTKPVDPESVSQVILRLVKTRRKTGGHS